MQNGPRLENECVERNDIGIGQFELATVLFAELPKSEAVQTPPQSVANAVTLAMVSCYIIRSPSPGINRGGTATQQFGA
jgi:hypothetical protein